MIQHPDTGATLFAEHELASPDDGTIKLAAGFADALRDLRVTFGRPMRVNSCCRTPTWNRKVNGHLMSYHLTQGNLSHGTCAIDIHIPTDAYRAELVRLALNADWTVGVYPRFVHLDRRADIGRPRVLFHGK